MVQLTIEQIITILGIGIPIAISILIYFIKLEGRVRHIENLEQFTKLESRIKELELLRSHPLFTAFGNLGLEDALNFYKSARGQKSNE